MSLAPSRSRLFVSTTYAYHLQTHSRRLKGHQTASLTCMTGSLTCHSPSRMHQTLSSSLPVASHPQIRRSALPSITSRPQMMRQPTLSTTTQPRSRPSRQVSRQSLQVSMRVLHSMLQLPRVVFRRCSIHSPLQSPMPLRRLRTALLL